MYTVDKIKYEKGNFWVYETDKGTYEVYRVGVTCSTRCAIIGFKGEKGLNHAIRECNKRAEQSSEGR